MRNNGYQLVKFVTPTSGATKKTVLATYEDRGTKYSFTKDSGNLAYRLAQAFDVSLLEQNIADTLYDAFGTDDFAIAASVVENIAWTISDSNSEIGTVIRPLKTDGLSYLPVTRDASEYDGNTAQILGEYFNHKGQHKGFRIRFNDAVIEVASAKRRVAFKSYGLSTLYGTFVKKPLAAYALSEAHKLTESVNTANTYHHVKYVFRRSDVGEAV